MGAKLSKYDLDTPALVLDARALRNNIEQMARFFSGQRAKLRPHAKTHKCPQIARLQLEAGAIGITCAKLGEAEALADVASDILIANQVVGAQKLARLVALQRRADVMVAVDCREHVGALSQAAWAAGATLRVLVEVDVGMGRCGVASAEEALELARIVSRAPGLRFCGLQGYEGHAVMIPDPGKRRETAEAAMAYLVGVRRYIEGHGLPVEIVSGGGTGTYNITGAYPGVDEVQAGSYATMDAKYAGIVPEFQPALTVLCTVISRPAADRAILDAGLKAVTSEFGMPLVVGLEEVQCRRLAEEHAILEGPGASKLRVGDKVELIPSHGCTTINLHERYYVLEGETVVDEWPITARGRCQ